MLAFTAAAFTTANVPSDGIYRFTFGVGETQDGAIPVSANAVCDVKDETLESGKFSYGFLGTTDTSYIDDVPWSLNEPRAIDGFSVVSGQKIVLRNATDANNVSCVAGPVKADYFPAGASDYEGRYPVRFAMRGEEYAYYAVTCTVANASSTANADVTLFSERSHIIAHHLSLAPGETKTFAWSVELAPNVFKTQGTYHDDCVNVCVVGENAALASLTVVKQPQTPGTVRGAAVENMNVGRTMWLCTDSTGTDQPIATPFFSLQNYAGVGSGLSRWAPANLSIRNQGEGGLATSANAHRQSCRLKPGDYLYVEYGHNEGGVTSFTNNLETYLSDANDAGAYLVIVSPVERRNSWDGATSTWGRSLQGIAEAGEAWVTNKIANGVRNVAFIDLNKKYNDWMNNELRRINGVNDDVSLNAAISFYYRSAKGANVDNTHINTAGADWAAYWVWQDALERVAAGANAEEGSAAKVQSDVLKGITEGCQLKVGVDGTVDNTPWLVSDEIINAGAAPNSFWDTPVSEGYAYVNDAAVANVDATANADGTVTITGVTMRILNPNNYYKSVIEVFGESGLSQGVYYSYYNYDIGGAGKVSGDLVNPNQPGFLTSDKGKDDVSAADVESVTVPAGGKALVWIAEADAGTWQVGENAPCSAKYPVEWWSDVIFDNDCSSLDGWTVNSQAVNEYSLSDKGGIYFMSAGADAGNTKKNYGFYHQFDNAVQMTNGRYRVSFKVMMDSGHITWQLFNSLGTTTNPFNGTGTTLLDVRGTALTSYAGTAPLLTLGDEDAPQNIVNKLRWIDVDAIIDRDNDRAWVSAGGSDYVEYQNAAFLPGSYAGTTWKYFGISCESQMSSYGYVDDVKIVKLTSVEYPTVTANATCNPGMGSVAINGYATDSLTVYAGNDLLFKATSDDPDMYAFEGWTDAGENVVSTSPTYYVADATESISLSANFREYGHDENRVITWDFSAYQGDFEVTGTANKSVVDNGMTLYLGNGDSITGDGLRWDDVSVNKAGSVVSSHGRQMQWTAPVDGMVSVTYQASDTPQYGSNGKPQYVYMYAYADGTEVANSYAATANTDATLTFAVEAGKTYVLWTYIYNRHSRVVVKSITYTYAPVRYTVTAAVNNANYGSATADGAASAEVFSGREVTFVATPVSSAYRFVNWTDGEENIVSTEATLTIPVSADVAYTANFEKAAAGDAVEMRYDFAPLASSATSCTGVSTFDYGCFKFQMISGDSIGASGATWYKVAVDDKSALGTALSETGDHYIKFTAPYDGTVSFKTSVDSLSSKYKAALYIKAEEAASACTNSGDAKVDFTEANKVYTLSLNVTAGTTYYVWAYSWNAGAGGYSPYINILSVTYSHAPDPTTLAVANGDAQAGTVTVNGASITEAIDVQKGEYVHLVATPNAGGLFGGWKNDSEEVVSTETDFWLCVEEATSLTATWRTVNTHSFTWNWNVAEGDWNDPANWLYEGGVPATTCPNDAAEDYATFTSPATVRLTEAAAAKEVWFNADVTLTGGTLAAQLVTTYNNQGKVTLSNAGFANPNGCGITVSNDMVMAQGTVNWINQYETSAQIYGGFKGTGTIRLYNADNNYHGAKLRGDNREFAGEVIFSGGSGRRYQYWADSKATSSNATWTVESGAPTYVKNADGDMVGGSGTYYFGCYNGTWWKQNYANNYTMEIGALNIDSRIDFYTFAKEPNVTKVGSAKLTLGTQCLKDLNVKGGTVNLVIGTGIDTLTMVADTCLEISGDAAWTDGTVTNLFSYTTLSVATSTTLPQQVEVTGLAEGLVAKITVEDNTVTATIEAAEVAPTTDDENATITKNGDGTYTVQVEAETVAITVPDRVTVSEVVVSPNTATVTGVPASATVKVAVSWADAQETQHSAAYAIVKVNSETGAVSLDDDAVVTVGEEEIALRPELGDAGDEVAPLDVGEDVSVCVKSIPGLVYRLARGTAVDEIDTSAANAVAEEKAASSRVSLVDDDPPADGAFYRVTVELK